MLDGDSAGFEMRRIYEPEDFLDTLDRMIEMSECMLEVDEEYEDEIIEDLERLRDLQRRIRLQFGMEEVTWN